MPVGFNLSCVLFDLDGTLLDTAPDLIACLNKALRLHGFPTASAQEVMPFISYGANAMITASQKTVIDESVQASILETLHDLYLNNIADQSIFYDGMASTLEAIESQGLKWGVVTNKLKRFTEPLMDKFRLAERASCIISGDSAAKPKPSPEPMLLACRQAGVLPEACVFIGDAAHDIAAGKGVGMKTLVALYGYLNPGDQPETWGADALIASPGHITEWIGSTQCR